MGVAVVFDDSDEDNEGEGGGSDVDEDQVVDASDTSSEEEDAGEDVPKDIDEADDDGEVVVQEDPMSPRRSFIILMGVR